MINVSNEQDEYWMAKAITLATEAEALGEVPVGAIVVLDDKIIGQGFNRSIIDNDPSAHAEMLAIRDAAKHIENYRIVNATLYVTLEPCPMCAGAIVHSRIKRVVYGASDQKTGAAGSVMNLLTHTALNHKVDVHNGCLSDVCSTQISDFFKMRRKQIKAKRTEEKAKEAKRTEEKAKAKDDTCNTMAK